MFAKCLPYPFRHKEVEGGDSLSAMLLVLVCLEYDGGQSGITLNGLWSTDTSVLVRKPRSNKSSRSYWIQVVVLVG